MTIRSYIGETGRKLDLRIKEHRKEVDSFTAGTQTRASRAMESNVTHKSAITDHAVEQTMSSTGTVQKWSPGRHIDKPDGSRRHFGFGTPDMHESGRQW